MPVNFFPDTDVLLTYLNQSSEYHKNAIKLMEATKKGAIDGIIVVGVSQEFKSIISHFDGAFDFIRMDAENWKKTQKGFREYRRHIQKLMKDKSILPSRKIPLDMILFKTENQKYFDVAQINKFLEEIQLEFSERIKEINEIFEIQDSSMKRFNVNQAIAINKIFYNKKAFPIKKSKDIKDNTHLVSATLCCVRLEKLQKEGWFVTIDNFRSNQKWYQRDDISKKIFDELSVNLRIHKLNHFAEKVIGLENKF